MKHGGSIFVIGIILVIMPLLGFPAIWKNFFVSAAGLWLCGIVIMRLKRHQTKKISHKKESRYSAVAPVPDQTSSESSKETLSENTYDKSPQI
ncbi:MAG: hypothetical protein Q7S86_03905 [bacterium]|nr:hypothetical protein [bacterium]